MITDAERAALQAAMERILPSTDGAGAMEADAIGYVDWLTAQRTFQDHLARLKNGIRLLDEIAATLWSAPFAHCSPSQRDAVLQRLAQAPESPVSRFFVMLVRMTLCGFLCAPEYGGNRDRVGWAYVGFESDAESDGNASAPSEV